MALEDRVTARLSAQRVVELTNPQLASATTTDAARLAAAARDTEAELQVYAGVAYDDANALHGAAGVEGVVYYLLKRAGVASEAIKQAETSWRDWLARLAEVTGRNRLLPLTTSNLTASREDTTGGAVRPDFDRERFADTELRSPGGAADERRSTGVI